MFQLSPHLWTPQRRGVEQTMDLLQQGKSVCLYSPTGGGKTTQAVELLRWAESNGFGGIFYVNRRLLIQQTLDRITKAGLHCGVRAAEYPDLFDFGAPFQVASADTERARVLNTPRWAFHDVGPGGVVVVDEAHIQRTETMRLILDNYRRAGARIVLLTATPIGLSDWADEIVISGRLQEYRDCKALVPAVVKSIEQPDLSKVKRNATGEFILDGKKSKIYTQTIVGNVIDRWKKYNPDARPTMLFAPGKPESVWFTEQFHKLGVSWAHVDATDAVVDGQRYRLSRALWEDILAGYSDNRIKGLSCRFKLREGIDVPATYHCILATPIGSLASYIQTVGRVLRYSAETPDSVLVTDHGGSYHRLGSPNKDRDWRSWWTLPEHAVSNWHLEQIRDGKTPEPIRCPQCEGEREKGITCPHCGYTHQKSQRMVVMEDGRMVVMDGRLVKPKYVKMQPDTQRLWDKMYFAWKRKKVDRSFNQLEGFFAHEHGYHPPRTLANMPKKTEDWYRKVHAVPVNDLTPKGGAA